MRTLALALAVILTLAFAVADSAATAADTKADPAQTRTKKKQAKIDDCVDTCVKAQNLCKTTCDKTHETPRGRGYCKESCDTKAGEAVRAAARPRPGELPLGDWRTKPAQRALHQGAAAPERAERGGGGRPLPPGRL